MAARKLTAFRLEPLLIEAMKACSGWNSRELIEEVMADYFYKKMQGNVSPEQLEKETAGGRSQRGVFKFAAQWTIAFWGGEGFRMLNPKEPRKSFYNHEVEARDCWVVTEKEYLERLRKSREGEDTVDSK